jgi:diacylglycerol kinase (ATP)
MGKNLSLLKSLSNAFQGLRYIVNSQRNARIHLATTIIIILLGILLRIGFVNWAILFVAISLVWIAESFNTSLENLFDLVNPVEHPLVKNGKDSSAAAVLISAILSLALGLIALGPSLLQFVRKLFGI